MEYKKILIIFALPALLVGGCMSKKQISKEQAAEVAMKIAEKQSYNVEDITTISITSEIKNEIKAKNDNGAAEDYVGSEYKSSTFEYDSEGQFLHLADNEKRILDANHSVSESWMFIKDGYFYYLYRSHDSLKEGFRYNAKDLGLFDWINYIFRSNVSLSDAVKSTNLAVFDTALNYVKNGQDLPFGVEERFDLSMVEYSANYFSDNDDQLKINTLSKISNVKTFLKGLRGDATGKVTLMLNWEALKQSNFKLNSSYEFVSSLGGYEVRLSYVGNTTINVRYPKSVVKIPSLSSFDIRIFDN